MYPFGADKQYRVTALVCTLNEAENLPHVLPKIPEWVDEILLIDACSMDNTIEVARELKPEIQVRCQQDKGKGNALRYGIQQASGSIIVTLDADGSTDPAEISMFIDALLRGYDFAKGSRFLGKHLVMSPVRSLGNHFLVILTNILFGTKYTDLCAGLNAFWKDIIAKIDPEGTSFLDEPTIYTRLKKKGLRVIEVPQCDKGRLFGTANEHLLTQGLRILTIVMAERFRD